MLSAIQFSGSDIIGLGRVTRFSRAESQSKQLHTDRKLPGNNSVGSGGKKAKSNLDRLAWHSPAPLKPSFTRSKAPMRINLRVPYASKDQAKALNARWDYELRTWYIEDIEDLTPFIKWIDRSAGPCGQPKEIRPPSIKDKARWEKNQAIVKTTIATECRLFWCNCNSLAWEHCEHTEKTEAGACAEMLA